MAHAQDASGRWSQLDGLRRGFIRRCEKFAAYTIPKLCTPDGYDQNSQSLQHDFQAVGAQAVNHLANKLMLALFAPSRPFFRLDPNAALKAQLAAADVPEDKIADLLVEGEKAAITELDKMAMRPKLYEAVKHLIVLGNVLLTLEKNARVIGIKNYCARRSNSGQLLELIIADKVMFDELEPEVQQVCLNYPGFKDASRADRQVTLFRWITRTAEGDYVMTTWVDKYLLPKKFSGKWSEKNLPFRVLTWDLSDDAHYGTGLVEDYHGDFAGMSTLSKAQIMGAILSSEFRWLVNPSGATRVEDFRDSENGAALPGLKDDVTIVQSGKAQDLQIVLSTAQEYIRRIGSGFLLGSAVTRDAERVTAEEIRMQAQELETSLGGAYSRLAVDFQLPMALWLMARVGLGKGDEGVEPTIVTGLDALSRNGDYEALKRILADAAALAQLPEMLQARMKMDAVIKALARHERVNVDSFFYSEAEMQQMAQQAQAQEQQQMAAQAGANAAQGVAVNQSKEQA